MQPLPIGIKKKTLLWLRGVSFMMDMAVIYSLGILLRPVIWKFAFISLSGILAAVFLVYYIVSYRIFAGRTPARFLTGLSVKQKDLNSLTWKAILLREGLLKWGCGILIPFFLIEELVPLWSYLHVTVVFFIVLSVTIISVLLCKKTWWELLSGTVSIKKDVDRVNSRPFFYVLMLIIISAISVTLYPFISGENSVMNNFYPRYPVTKETGKYAGFIKSHGRDPVEYIFDLFQKRDIVVISERLHPEYTQYDLIFRIISDDRFAQEVGNIFTECGSVSFQDTLTSYLHTSFIAEDDLDKSTAVLQRNSNSVWPLWSNNNLFDFFKTVNKLNRRLPDSAKINWYFTGPPVDWQTMTNEKYLQAYTNPLYDSIMASHIIDRYKTDIAGQKRHKALVIMNSRHAYGLPLGKDKEYFARKYKGTTTFLMQCLPEQVANVLMNTVSIKYGYMTSPIQYGKWDRAFAEEGNPDVGFDLAGSPFGEDRFDLAFIRSHSVKYSDMFTGFIFYKPLNLHIIKDGFPHMFDNFEDTIIKRAGYVNKSHAENIKHRIANYKQHPDQPILMEPTKYAILYNIANVVVVPFLLFISLLISIMFFIRQPGSHGQVHKL